MAIYYKEPESPQWLSLVNSLTSGLGDVAEVGAMAYSKHAQTKKRKDALERAGYSPDMADQIASAGDEYTLQALQSAESRKTQQSQREAYANMMAAARGGIPMQRNAPQEGLPGTPPPGPLNQQEMGPMSQLQGLGQPPQATPQQQQFREVSPEEQVEMAVRAGIISPEDAVKQVNDLKKEERKSRESAFKETKGYRKEMLDLEKGARDNIHLVQQIRNIDKYGDPDSAAWSSLLKLFHIEDYSALRGKDSAYMNKLIKNFLPGAKKVFGSRVTEGEIRMFMQQLPTLDMSPEQRGVILDELERMFNKSIDEAEDMRSIIKDNNGKPPLNLMEQVSERATTKFRERNAAAQAQESERTQAKTQQFTGGSEIPAKATKIRNAQTGEILYLDPETGEPIQLKMEKEMPRRPAGRMNVLSGMTHRRY